MISCPACQKAVEIEDKHLGTIFTCPHCSAVYFIDWSGQPEMADHSQTPSETIIENSTPEVPSYSEGFESAAFEPTPFEPTPFESSDQQVASLGERLESTEVPSWQNEEQPIETYSGSQAYNPENTQGETIPEYQAEEPAMYDVVSESEQEAPVAEETSYDFSQTLDSIPTPVMQDPQDSLAEIVSFANTEANGSGFSYDITIKGLDSAQTVKLFREAIADSRFAWNEEEIIGQVEKGQLLLKAVAPVKAAVLVDRIKYLELDISWSQSVYG